MKARIPGGQGGGQMAMMKRIQEMTVTGAHEVKDIKLQPDVVDPEDIDMLADLLIAATNEAMRKADDAMEQAMGAFKSGLNLPF